MLINFLYFVFRITESLFKLDFVSSQNTNSSEDKLPVQPSKTPVENNVDISNDSSNSLFKSKRSRVKPVWLESDDSNLFQGNELNI